MIETSVPESDKIFAAALTEERCGYFNNSGNTKGTREIPPRPLSDVFSGNFGLWRSEVKLSAELSHTDAIFYSVSFIMRFVAPGISFVTT